MRFCIPNKPFGSIQDNEDSNEVPISLQQYLIKHIKLILSFPSSEVCCSLDGGQVILLLPIMYNLATQTMSMIGFKNMGHESNIHWTV